MNKPMITKGTFADFRLIKTRKLAQLVIEIPIEEADTALASLGGLPRSDAERWVAVARLDLEKSITEDKKERRAFCDLPLSQQAGIKSNDLQFQLFMSRFDHFSDAAECPDCASAIRRYCGVDSRADILPGTTAGERWLNLLREFDGVR